MSIRIYLNARNLVNALNGNKDANLRSPVGYGFQDDPNSDTDIKLTVFLATDRETGAIKRDKKGQVCLNVVESRDQNERKPLTLTSEPDVGTETTVEPDAASRSDMPTF